jgi:hypothetical protein
MGGMSYMTIPDTYFEFEARSDGSSVEVRPAGEEEPVFVFTEADLEFLWETLEGALHPDLTWHVVPRDS